MIFAPLMSSSSSYAAATTGAAAGAVAPVVVNPGVTLPASTQFDMTGFLQVATLGGAGTGAGIGLLQGGSLVVNNHTVIVPSNTIVILPASALTWAELFTLAPAPYTGVATGLAQADVPAPISTYEVHVAGNRVGDTYIAGMVDIAQQGLNNGAGYINFIDYNVGPNSDAEIRVGGLMNDPNCVAAPNNPAAGGLLCSGARVRINDPLNPTSAAGGRFGRASSPDVRFAVDQDNPTIASATGFPMCLPRTLVDPAATAPGSNVFTNLDDINCPRTNRPLDPTQFNGFALTTNTLVAGAVIPGYIPNALFQAPIEVGDFINYAGNLVNDSATPISAVAGATTYISAHTISDNFAAYTRPGIDPAYVSIETSLIGTGGLNVLGAGEAAIRSRFEGMTTDPTRNVHIYAIDFNPLTGVATDRDWGSVSPDPGPPNGAVEGRWRIRPPCTGNAGTVSSKICIPASAGNYVPPPREMRAVVDGVTATTPPLVVTPGFTAPLTVTSPTAANGIVYGQYHAPIDEYIFPENVPGTPIVPNNFEAIPFLAYGGYTSAAGTLVTGRLDPWPGQFAPSPAVCVAPTITNGPFTLSTNGSITLSSSVNAGATSPVALAWSVSSATLGSFTAGANTATPTFTAGATGGTGTITLTATNVCGAASTTSPITVQAAQPPPIVNPILNQTTTVGSLVALTASSPSTAPLSFTFTQTGGAPIIGGFPQTVNGTPATVTFIAPAAPTVLTFSVTATNAGGTSQAVTATITVNAIPVNTVLTPAEWRAANQRLSITATFGGAAAFPNAVLKLQPYLTKNGTIFDPATLGNTFTNTGGGIYTIVIAGAPQPAAAANVAGATAPFTPGAAPLIVVATNTVGAVTTTVGTSAPTALTRIR